MKKTWSLLLTLLLLTSCGGDSGTDTETVAVSVAPQAWFVDRLSGGMIETQVMVPPGTNPEVYDPSPRDIARLERADLYIYLGTLPYEAKWLEALSSDGPRRINLADSIPHDLVHTHCDEHGHAHPHGDPHYWSSYRGGLAIAEVTYRALCSAFPDRQETFSTNYTQLVDEITAARDEAQAYFSSLLDSVAFVIYHPSLTQYSEEMGLRQLVIERDGKSPTPRQLADLIDTARRRHARVALIQQEYDPHSAENIAKELGIPTVQINPHNPDWLSEMNHLLEALQTPDRLSN